MDRHYINDPQKTDEQLTSARDAWLNKYVKRYKPEPFKYRDPIKTTEAPKNLPGTTVGNLLGTTTTNAQTPGYTPVNIVGNNSNLPNRVNTFGHMNANPSYSSTGYTSAMPSTNYVNPIPSSTPYTPSAYTSKPFQAPDVMRTATIDPQQPIVFPKIPTVDDDDGVTIESMPYEQQIKLDNDEKIANLLSSKNAIFNMENDMKKLDSIYEKFMDGVKVHEKSIQGEDITPELKNFQEKYGTTDTQGAIRESEAEFKKIADNISTFNDTIVDNEEGINSDLYLPNLGIVDTLGNIPNLKIIETLGNTFKYLGPEFVKATQSVSNIIGFPDFGGMSADLLGKTPGAVLDVVYSVPPLAYDLGKFTYNRYGIKESTKQKNAQKEEERKVNEDEIYDEVRQRLTDLDQKINLGRYHYYDYKRSVEYNTYKAIRDATIYASQSVGNVVANTVGSVVGSAASLAYSGSLSATQFTYIKMIEYGTRLYNGITEELKNLVKVIDENKLSEEALSHVEHIKMDMDRFAKVTAFLKATKIFSDEQVKDNTENIVENMILQEEYPSKSRGTTFDTRLAREELSNKQTGIAQLNENLEDLKIKIRSTKEQLNKFSSKIGGDSAYNLGEKYEALIMAAYLAFSNDRNFVNLKNPIGINAEADFTIDANPVGALRFDDVKFPTALPGQDENIFFENAEEFSQMINFVEQFTSAIVSTMAYGGEGAAKTIDNIISSASQFLSLFNPSVFVDTGKPGTVYENMYKDRGTKRGLGIKKYNKEIADLKTGHGIRGIPLIKDKMVEMIGGLLKDMTPKYKTYEPIHKIIDHMSTLPKFRRGGLVRKESYGCGICKGKPGYGKRFLVHNKNNKDITCSNCFGDHGMTGGRMTERDAEFNYIEDSKDPEHEEMVSNQKTNDYLDEIEKETPNTAFEDFDASANIDKRFVERMGSSFVVNRPYDMRKNFESKDLDRLAYLVGMHEHAPEQMTTPLKVNMEALAINHLTKYNDPKATFPNPSKLQNFDSTKQELQHNPGFLKRFLQ